MLRSSIYGAGVLALSAAALAQKQELRSFERITGPIKDGGVYHLATGQWTRGGAVQLAAGAGSDIVYNCTTESGYYAAMDPGHVWTASGRIPSTTSPNTLWNPIQPPVGSAPGSAQGCANSYTIDGFQVAYCSDSVGPTTQMTVAFYQSYNPTCSTAVIPPATGGPFPLTGLPGNPVGSTTLNSCWVITIDLAGVTSSFPMLADGDGTYVDNTSDAFGWTFTFPTITTTTARTGAILAGCPADATGPNHTGVGWLQFPPSINDEAGGYDGTRFDTVSGANVPTYPANGAVGLPTPGGEAGSDMLADDGMRIEGGAGPTPGCYFFGGPVGSGGNFDGPYSNFHLELYAKTVCTPPPPGTESCAGDGLDPLVTTPCGNFNPLAPCNNFGGLGRGCASSFNANGARISGSGSVAADTVVLTADGVNATGNAIFMRGNIDNIIGTQFGDGVRCVDGTLIRRTKPISTPNQATFPSSTDTVTLSTGWGAANATPPGSGITAHYMAYYRNAAAAFCPPETFNGTNMYTITW